MAQTRAQGVEAFRHVMTEVLLFSEFDNLWMALTRENYNSMRHVAVMTNQDIDELSFEETVPGKDENSPDTIRLKQVPKVERRPLQWLLYWRDWKSKQLTSFTYQHWLDLTIEEFDEFCMNVLPELMNL
mmetsp:Transcript_14311/g.16643  ORF Transcript_14311/g.16643 Transcript_14311/m.16643 type:complete len:129 (-) Transcript_14311:170-556(-)